MSQKFSASCCLLIALTVLFLVAVVSCGSPDVTTPAPAPASFALDIQPVFDASCVSCHNFTTFAGGLDLSPGVAHKNLVNAQSGQSTRKRVSPGSPDNSYLVNKLLGNQSTVGGTGGRMPPGAPLPDATITLVRQWISQGALDN
jgi:hypothetical protein